MKMCNPIFRIVIDRNNKERIKNLKEDQYKKIFGYKRNKISYINLPNKIKVQRDSGYPGIKKIYTNSDSPKKNKTSQVNKRG